MKIDPEHHHFTGDVTLPCEVRDLRPQRCALPVAQIYIRDLTPVVIEQPPAKGWHISFTGAAKPAKEDKFTQRLSRLN